MKQRDLIRKLELIGFEFARHGCNHDIYKRGNDEEQKYYRKHLWQNWVYIDRRLKHDNKPKDF